MVCRYIFSAIIVLFPEVFINLFIGNLRYEDVYELRLMMTFILVLSAIFLFLDTLDGNLSGHQQLCVAALGREDLQTYVCS